MSAEVTPCEAPLAGRPDEGSDSAAESPAVDEEEVEEERGSRWPSCRSSGLRWRALCASGTLLLGALLYLHRFPGATLASGSLPLGSARVPWQHLSFEQAYDSKYLNDKPFICNNKSVIDYLRDKVPENVVMNAFDNNYVGQAQDFAKRMDSVQAAYVGFCKEPECVEKFWAGCEGCRAHILHCPNYIDFVAKESYVPNTTRCRGWRDIQHIKSFAFYDVVKAGKNVFMSDLDHDMKKIDFDDLLNRYDFADVLIFVRDYPSEFVNYGLFFVRNSAAVASIANHLRKEVHTTWDQAIFNYQMADLENAKRLHCVELDYERFESRRLKVKKRCGLELTDIREDHHPRCWKPPE